MDFFYLRAALFAAVFVPASISDLRTLTVPRAPLLALCAALTALAAFPGSRPDFFDSLAGTGEAFLALGGTRALTKKKLGLADVWAGMCAGALGGSRAFAGALAIALASACAFAILSRATWGTRIPFLPHLGAAALVSVFFFRFLGNR